MFIVLLILTPPFQFFDFFQNEKSPEKRNTPFSGPVFKKFKIQKLLDFFGFFDFFDFLSFEIFGIFTDLH